MLKLTNAKNTMNSLTIFTFNQLQSKPLVCTASPLTPSWAISQRNLLTSWATAGRNSGSTSTCFWPWSERTVPAYWLVCQFNRNVLAILSALTPWRLGGFGDFRNKNRSFRLPYQRPSSSANCARELFNGSNGSASLVDCTRKKNFCLGCAGFLWVTS